MAKREHLLIFDLNNQKGTFKLIMILFNRGRTYSSKVRRLGMNDRTIMRARKVLQQLELITITSDEGSPRLYYELTNKGQMVAEKLVELERILFMV